MASVTPIRPLGDTINVLKEHILENVKAAVLDAAVQEVLAPIEARVRELLAPHLESVTIAHVEQLRSVMRMSDELAIKLSWKQEA